MPAPLYQDMRLGFDATAPNFQTLRAVPTTRLPTRPKIINGYMLTQHKNCVKPIQKKRQRSVALHEY